MTPEGKKELVGFADGVREDPQWAPLPVAGGARPPAVSDARVRAPALAGLRASATETTGTVSTRRKCRCGFGRCAT